MERLSLLKTPSNSLAIVEIPRYRLDAAHVGQRLTLALDDVQNPETWGRSSAWPTGSASGDPLLARNGRLLQPQGGAGDHGAILRVRVHYVELAPLLAQAAARGVPVYGTFLEGENLYDAQLTDGGSSSWATRGAACGPTWRRR